MNPRLEPPVAGGSRLGCRNIGWSPRRRTLCFCCRGVHSPLPLGTTNPRLLAGGFQHPRTRPRADAETGFAGERVQKRAHIRNQVALLRFDESAQADDAPPKPQCRRPRRSLHQQQVRIRFDREGDRFRFSDVQMQRKSRDEQVVVHRSNLYPRRAPHLRRTRRLRAHGRGFVVNRSRNENLAVKLPQESSLPTSASAMRGEVSLTTITAARSRAASGDRPPTRGRRSGW